LKYYFLYLIPILIPSCNRNRELQLKKIENIDYDKAYEYVDNGKPDSSFFFFDRARQVFLDNGDSLGVAKCLVNMAITQKDQGDFYGAQETALQALDFMNKNNLKHHIYLSTNYNNLGAATVNLNDLENAISFYNLAIRYSDDSINTVTYKNNLALCYQKLEKFEKAIAIYNEIANVDFVKSSPVEYARVLSNLARTKWLQNSNYNALPELHQALKIRQQENDLWGQNASLSHLSDFYVATNHKKSLVYAESMYEIASRLKSSANKLQALEKLIKLAPYDRTKRYFQEYQQLNDSIQQARSAAKNQFALIRYEVEKNKADNLRLEKENVEKQNRLVRQRAITGASIFLLLLAVGGGTLWYKRRKLRLELEAENKVKETQLHLSKKVHDVVANDIYHVMTEVEYRDDLDREVLLDKLEIIYNQSRDISHNVEQRSTVEVPYNEQISTLLKPYGTSDRRISIVGIDAEQWGDVSKRIKVEIKHVLQELMVNMKKHSAAERVVVRIEKSDQELKIFYKDNGVGLPAERPQGKGMANTVSRIESLGGGIIFDSEPGEGLSITVNIPLI